MAQLANTPRSETHLRLEARKSFSFAVRITDANARPVDLTGAELAIAVRRRLDDTNLITNAAADTGAAAKAGYARFNLQASDLDHPAGEYPFAIALKDSDGYTTVLVRGTLEIVENPETDWVDSEYSASNASTALDVTLRGSVIEVRAGHLRAPDEEAFTTADKAKLDGLDPKASAAVQADWEAGPGTDGYILNRPLNRLVPHPGAGGQVLTSTGNSKLSFMWAQPTGGGGFDDIEDPDDPGFFIPRPYGGLAAGDAAVGAVPTANGAGSWGWAKVDIPVQSVNGKTGAVVLRTQDVAPTASRQYVTTAQLEKLAALDSDGTMTWDGLPGKPAFGTASALNTDEVVRTGAGTAADIASGTLDKARVPKVTALNGFTYGTAAPTGGSDGDLYFQHG